MAQAAPLKPVMILPEPPGWARMSHLEQCALWERHAVPHQEALTHASHEDTRDRA